MGRQPRLIADGLVYHALNRGNNRARVFFHEEMVSVVMPLRGTQKP